MVKVSKLDTILKSLEQKDSESIRTLLQSSELAEKGKTLEHFIGELFKGNGWLVNVSGGRGDKGADILLYHPKTPSKVALIIQAKNQRRPLTFDDTKIELIKFEQQAASKYQCQQFSLISLSGFVDETQKLSQFNMLLNGWDYINDLIERYDPNNKNEPEIELYAHNKTAYENAVSLWKDNKYVAVVQATGTGKSYVIAKVMSDFLSDNKLVMAPSNYILKQQSETVPWAAQSTKFITYAKGANLTSKEIIELAPKLIVLDEFHRCGAEVWGVGVQRILKAYPKSYVLGTSATPIRYLDSSRDMSEELFNGIVAVNLSLAEAIIRNILPAPQYVAALYTLNEEVEDLLDLLEKSSKSEGKKKELAAEINKAKLDWEKTSGIPQILSKYIKPDINKFIVFCKDQEHLDEMQIEVSKWFLKAKTHKRSKIYRVSTDEPESDNYLDEFKRAKSKDTAHLLFAIDMFNEGLHIPDVGAVILLRPTESPIIFYQQIGRCIQVGVEHTPIIFDLVNNFQNIRANDFLENIEEARDNERERRAELGLEEYAPIVHIHDETKDVLTVFEAISERLLPWEALYQQLTEYKVKYGDCTVPSTWQGNLQLARWVNTQRTQFNTGKLNATRIKRLDDIDFEWDPHEELWESMYSALIQYQHEHGHSNVPHTWQENTQLAIWVSKQRSKYKSGKQNIARIKLLNEIGFVWDLIGTQWENMYSALVQYQLEHGNCNVPREWPENPQLSRWVDHQRQRYSGGKLDDEFVKRLELIGFIWDLIGTQWENMYSALIQYQLEHGNCNVPHEWPENQRLAIWVGSQRTRYNRGKLDTERVKRLEYIGFVWVPREEVWENMYSALVQYQHIYGNCNVPDAGSENPQLAIWVVNQRMKYKKGKLEAARIQRLEDIGFVWDPIGGFWGNMYSALVKYKRVYGNCNVPREWPENPQLEIWTRNQRMQYRRGKLDVGHIKRLENIGFVWNPHDKVWENMYSALVEYQRVHGDCSVSQRNPENPQLAAWINTQRTQFNKGKLDAGRIKRLEDIGFVWNPHDKIWENMYSALVEYQLVHGDCIIPDSAQENHQLATWIDNQRSKYNRGKLEVARINRLKDIGFVWDPHEQIWEDMYSALVEYHRVYGNCDVPYKWKGNTQLGIWVLNQRGNYKKGKLSEGRIRRLEQLGFKWIPDGN